MTRPLRLGICPTFNSGNNGNYCFPYVPLVRNIKTKLILTTHCFVLIVKGPLHSICLFVWLALLLLFILPSLYTGPIKPLGKQMGCRKNGRPGVRRQCWKIPLQKTLGGRKLSFTTSPQGGKTSTLSGEAMIVQCSHLDWANTKQNRHTPIPNRMLNHSDVMCVTCCWLPGDKAPFLWRGYLWLLISGIQGRLDYPHPGPHHWDLPSRNHVRHKMSVQRAYPRKNKNCQHQGKISAHSSFKCCVKQEV